MCTAISMNGTDHYFGRNLDLEYHLNEEVTITPANYIFPFQHTNTIHNPYPMIGIATVVDEIPLYYDATNIHGLSMAGLNFPGNAVYHSFKNGKANVASFEFLPWILGQCQTTEQARMLLENTNILNVSFSAELPSTPLHWIISDMNRSIVVESVKDGINIYDDPVNILTNSPPFSYHLHNLSNYLNLTNKTPTGDLVQKLGLQAYSNGIGSFGLPGDLSSASRFVRAAFLLSNSYCGNTEQECISQFFHILDSVSHVKGSVLVNDKFEITYYSSCCNTTKGVYYYKTYNNARITAVDLHLEDLDASTLIRYPLRIEQDILLENH